MNLSLEKRADDEGCATQGARTAGDSVEHLLAAANAREEHVPEAVGGAVSGKGRVLLLAANLLLRDAIGECLAENGYKAVAVENTQEAIREITAGDFALVLYDPMVAGLSVEMFYRSVHQIDPDLCQRFVFMCGDRDDANTNQFINDVEGIVLRKPFDVENLLGSLALAALHRTSPSVLDDVSTDPVPLRVSLPAEVLPGGLAQLLEESVHREKVCAFLPRAQKPGRLPQAPPDREPEIVAKGGTSAFLLAGLALAIVLLVAFGKSYLDVRNRVDAAEVTHRAHEAEWTATAQELEQAAATQSNTEMIQRQVDAMAAERAKPRWVPVLRSAAACADVKIEVREVRASEKFGDEKMWTMLVGGVSTGGDPAVVADRYRGDLQRELDRMFPGRVTIRFERFEDLPGSSSPVPGERQGKFTITATIRFDEAEKAGSTEGS